MEVGGNVRAAPSSYNAGDTVQACELLRVNTGVNVCVPQTRAAGDATT